MSIPEELKTTPRWVCCTADKLPICPRNGAAASSTDPGTWSDYATAAGAVTRLGCRGIGFVLGGGIAGIDIDHCIDPETGVVDFSALAIVESMHSYTEISPSGTGLHILWRGTKAGPACRKALAPGIGLEMYDGGRYFTVTGRSWHDPPLPLAERTAEAAAVYHKYLDKPKPAASTAAQAIPVQPRPAGATSDSEILEKAKQAKGGEKLAALLAGDWQPYAPSRSEADLALCNLLAFWLGADKARMDAAFRASGLYRKKWDERRGADTYGNLTLSRALADCQEVYDPSPPRCRKPLPKKPKRKWPTFCAAWALRPRKNRSRSLRQLPPPLAAKPTAWTIPATPVVSGTCTVTGFATTTLKAAGCCGLGRSGAGTRPPPSSNCVTRCWTVWKRGCSASMIHSRPQRCANSFRKAAAAMPRTICSKRPSI